MKKVLLASLMLLGIVTNGKAAVGDTFVIDGLKYTVLTEDTDNGTGTVSVGKTTAGSTNDTNLSGEIVVGGSISNNGIAYQVTTVTDSGFRYCKSITKISLPEGITTIGTSAFDNCTSLLEITIPTSLTTIKNSAFNASTKLEKVFISDFEKWQAVTFGNNSSNPLYASNKAYLYIDGMDTLVIPEGTTSIKDKAYYKICGLKNIRIPSSVKTIGTSAFEGCIDLETIVIPEQVKTINSSTFKGCTSLTSVILPEGVTSIGASAFYGCTSLTEIFLPNSISTIGSYAFTNVTFNSLTLPSSLRTIGTSALAGCLAKEIIVPEGVTTIQGNAFMNCVELENINLPSSLTSITARTFNGCNKLTTINIPENLNGIENATSNPFEMCPLIEFQISENNPYYMVVDGVLYSKDMKTLVVYPQSKEGDIYIVPDGVENVKWVDYLTELKTLTLPFGILSLGTFLNSSIENVNFPSTLTSIGRIGKNVKVIDLRETTCLTSLPNNYFSAINAEEILLPNTITSIGDYCFRNCRYLKKIHLPNSVVKRIGTASNSNCGAFDDMAELEEITLGHIDKLFNEDIGNLPKVKNIAFPNSLTSMGNTMFSNTPLLKHITLPTYITSIGSNFGGSYSNVNVNIKKELTIPKSLNPALYMNDGDKLYIMGDEIPSNLKSNNANANITIYVKESVYNEKYPTGTWVNSQGRTFNVDYRIPVTMGTSTPDNSTSNFKSMCRDFDADFSDPNVTDPELKVWLAADYNGNNHNVMMQQLNYVPSRLKANVTDPETGELYQGVDEYVGIILEGTPGKTYYYKMGEHDYTQGAEGQWLLEDAQQNFLVGANDESNVMPTNINETTNETHVNYGLKNGYFKKYSSVGWITYNKSYLSLPENMLAGDENYEENNAKGLGFEFYELDGTTRILSAEEFSSRCEDDIFNGRTYNLQGQTVGDDYKGFVIQNGKKFIRK